MADHRPTMKDIQGRKIYGKIYQGVKRAAWPLLFEKETKPVFRPFRNLIIKEASVKSLRNGFHFFGWHQADTSQPKRSQEAGLLKVDPLIKLVGTTGVEPATP